jgi:hypothetical protein
MGVEHLDKVLLRLPDGEACEERGKGRVRKEKRRSKQRAVLERMFSAIITRGSKFTKDVAVTLSACQYLKVPRRVGPSRVWIDSTIRWQRWGKVLPGAVGLGFFIQLQFALALHSSCTSIQEEFSYVFIENLFWHAKDRQVPLLSNTEFKKYGNIICNSYCV